MQAKTHLGPVTVHVRWMIRRDLPEVLTIGDAYTYSWDEERIIAALRQRHTIGMVAEAIQGHKERHDCPVVGFMIYELQKKYIEVANFAVHPEWLGRGVGGQMLANLKGKLSSYRRTQIRLTVPETALGFQLFLKGQEFAATRIRRDWFDGEDGYRMVYQHAEAV